MRRAAIKWVVLGAMVAGLLAVLGIVRGTGSRPLRVTLASSTCSSSGFCVSSPSPGPVLYPGASASSLPLTFSNPMSVPLSVYQVSVTFTNSFTNCSSSAFQVNGLAVSGSPPGITITLPSPVTVPAASGSTPGTATYPATLALADNGQNQDGCKNLSLAMSYTGSAKYTVPTTTTLSSSPNPSPGSQPVTLTATVAPNITPSSAGSTPVGTVTFYKCSATPCTPSTGTSLGTSTLNSSGIATLTYTFTQLGSYYLLAVYTPTDGTNFSASGSSATPSPQVVQCTSSITTKTGTSLTVSSGQDVCITGTGIVSGNAAVNSRGRLDIQGGTINGSLTIQSGAALNVQGGTLGAGLTSTGATLFNVCGATLKSWANVSGSTAFVLVGNDGDNDGSPSCAGNTIDANLTLSSNTAGAEVGGNTTIRASVSVTGTTGAGPGTENASPEIEGNTINGNLSCSSNTPAPTDDGSPNAVSGTRSGQCGASGF